MAALAAALIGVCLLAVTAVSGSGSKSDVHVAADAPSAPVPSWSNAPITDAPDDGSAAPQDLRLIERQVVNAAAVKKMVLMEPADASTDAMNPSQRRTAMHTRAVARFKTVFTPEEADREVTIADRIINGEPVDSLPPGLSKTHGGGPSASPAPDDVVRSRPKTIDGGVDRAVFESVHVEGDTATAKARITVFLKDASTRPSAPEIVTASLVRENGRWLVSAFSWSVPDDWGP